MVVKWQRLVAVVIEERTKQKVIVNRVANSVILITKKTDIFWFLKTLR